MKKTEFKKIDVMTKEELNSLTKVSVGFVVSPIKDRKKVIGFRYKARINFHSHLPKMVDIKESTYNLLALKMNIVSGNAFRIDNCPVYFTKGIDAKGNIFYLYEIKLTERNYIRDFFSLDEIEIIEITKLPFKFVDRPEPDVKNLVSNNDIVES